MVALGIADGPGNSRVLSELRDICTGCVGSRLDKSDLGLCKSHVDIAPRSCRMWGHQVLKTDPMGKQPMQIFPFNLFVFSCLRSQD